jgi:hypothetical protein
VARCEPLARGRAEIGPVHGAGPSTLTDAARGRLRSPEGQELRGSCSRRPSLISGSMRTAP